LLADEMAVANAHPLGAHPWTRPDYVRKFQTLVAKNTSEAEAKRFLDTAQRLSKLRADDLGALGVVVDLAELICRSRDRRGIF
jgi:2-methylcitrate dehydratase